MCIEIEVRNNGTTIECTTMGQLADALGVPLDEVPMYGESLAEENQCLCSVRWERIPGVRRATDAEGFPWPEYIVEQPNAQSKPPAESGSA